MPPKFKTKFAARPFAAKTAHFTRTGEFLLIVESPSKIPSIVEYLGNQYNCIASNGHICELPSLKHVDIANNFAPTYTAHKLKLAHIEYMREAISQFPKQNIVLAMDSDREGEAIAYHICTTFRLPVETTKRIVFHEITRAALHRAILNTSVIDLNLVQAQQTRQILDIIIGFKVSPVLAKYVYYSKTNPLSAGRCQTPALRLIYDNYVSGLAKTVDRKYKVTGEFNGLLFEYSQEFDAEPAVRAFLTTVKQTAYTQLCIGDQKIAYKSPPVPLNTSKLLQMSPYSPKITMQLAQILYQGGHITYMRTDNQKYSGEFVEKARAYIASKYSEEHVGNLSAVLNTNNSNPHEGIRVTNLHTAHVNNSNTAVSTLYKLIWKNTVESCMAAASFNTHTLSIATADLPRHKFTHICEIPVFRGFMVLTEAAPTATNKYDAILRAVNTGVKFITPVFNYAESSVVFHGTHRHLTESSLIRRLEDLQIGRPSTYAMFAETIQDRGYVLKTNVAGTREPCTDFKITRTAGLTITSCFKPLGNETGVLVIQPIGILCIEFLIAHFNSIFNYDYTQQIEHKLDLIATPPPQAAFSHIDDNDLDKKANNYPPQAEPWYKLCEHTYAAIKTISKQVSSTTNKPVYMIDDTHELKFQQFGPCIKQTVNGAVEYIPVKANLQLDLQKLKNGEYALDELREYRQSYLGKYGDHDLFLKVGQHGPYLQYGTTNKSIKDAVLGAITLESAIRMLDAPAEADSANKLIVRVLDAEHSIRKGKIGMYVFYKTPAMKKPTFTSLKKCPHQFLDCDPELILDWLEKRPK